MRKLRVTTIFFAAASMAVAAPAPASTVVGSSLQQRADLYVRCDATCTELQDARPGGLAVATPVSGVITQWRVRAATQGAVRLRVLRPREDGRLRVVASSDEVRLDRPRQAGKDVLYTFPTRITVREGDRLALDRDRGAGGVFHSYGQNASYETATYAPALKDGEAPVEPTSTSIGRELLLNADVEKDGDGDGYGDETQDTCPTDKDKQVCQRTPPAQNGTGTGTATDVGTGTTTPTTGTEGPPVAGERSADRTQRGHGARPDGRDAPAAVREEQGSHGRRVAARRAPAKAPKNEDATHRARRRARRAPRRAPRTQSEEHRVVPRRKAPRKAPKTSDETHGSTPRRAAPRRAPKTSDEAHGQKPRRPAPRKAPEEPGFRPHDT